MRKLTDELRERLAKPFGEPLDGKAALQAVGKRKGKLVSVGDECSHFFLKAGVKPDVVIYDFKVKRQPIGEELKAALDGLEGKRVSVKNEPSTVSEALVGAVKRALEGKAARIFVDGEEDLAALVVLMFAQDDVVVAYGQPDRGIVIVTSSEKTRNRARKMYAKMIELPS